MDCLASEPNEWTPGPGQPQEPEFYRRVLDHLPTPVIVVDRAGRIRYANRAMLALADADAASMIGASLLDYAHPEERDWMTTAFIEVSKTPEARILGTSAPWAPVFVRMVTRHGTVVPVEVVGTGGVYDPFVNGVIYEVAPAQSRDILGRILAGLSTGASMHYLLSLIVEMIAGPPLDLEAAIIECGSGGDRGSTAHQIVHASTNPLLERALDGLTASEFAPVTTAPSFVPITTLPEHVQAQLAAAHFRDMWQVCAESPLTATTLRIIAVSPTHHVPDAGPLTRMVQARELAAVVLLKAQTGSGADYDPLTSFPNRAGFARLAEDLNPMLPRAAVHLDLDGMKRVNSVHGQAGGDAVLQIVADRIRSITRAEDLIGRVSGEEFVVAFATEHAEEDAAARCLTMAERLLHLGRQEVVVAGRVVSMSVSIGLADAAPGESTEVLLVRADMAMREARRHGGGLARYESPT